MPDSGTACNTPPPPGPSPLAEQVWTERYRDAGGPRGEHDMADTWRRVAAALARAEPPPRGGWRQRFLDAMRSLELLPGGRIIAGAGSRGRVTLSNCFVMGPLEPTMASMLRTLDETARTLQAGGGVGFDFSPLPPPATTPPAAGHFPGGPLGAMALLDALCRTVMTGSPRPGAMMACLRCDHPEVEAFVDAKRTAGRFARFNLSVTVTSAFMRAVARDADWPLVFPLAPGEGPRGRRVLWREWGAAGRQRCAVHRVVRARTLWRQLTHRAWESAEPGVLFIDRINRLDNLHWCETITATNPCGELPLPHYGACNLASVNLTRLACDPFTPQARLDWARLDALVATGVRLLDDAITISRFPLARQRETVLASRRVGLGITGLADLLVMLGIRYDEPAAERLLARLMRRIRDRAYAASVALARERGPFPAFEATPFLAGPFVKRLPVALRAAIARHGLRNSHLIAIAPTGSISLLAGNVSSGIEPVFAARYRRQIHERGGTGRWLEVEDYAWQLWQRLQPGSTPPPAFVTAAEVAPERHLAMQAVAQRYVDNAISKTINLRPDAQPEAIEAVFMMADRLGLKGCTVYRPNPVRGAVLVPEAPQHCCALRLPARPPAT